MSMISTLDHAIAPSIVDTAIVTLSGDVSATNDLSPARTKGLVRQCILIGEARHNIIADYATCDADDKAASDLTLGDKETFESLNLRGMTVILGNAFLQVIEGDVDAVAGIVDHIQRDGRHSGITQVSDRMVCEGEFTRWRSPVVDLSDVNSARVMRWFRVDGTLSVTHLDVDDICLWLTITGTLADLNSA